MDSNLNITAQDLGFIYQLAERSVTSGEDTNKVYHLKMKLIAIMKLMQDSQAKSQEVTGEVSPSPEAPSVAPATPDSLDMK